MGQEIGSTLTTELLKVSLQVAADHNILIETLKIALMRLRCTWIAYIRSFLLLCHSNNIKIATTISF
jgi:hypothetical protein